MLPYLIGILAGYVVGSIPTAYLVVRKRRGIDIRSAGSGNVGSFNTYTVTRSVGTAIVVGVLDGLKGLGIVLGATLAWGAFWPVAAALFGAILGHIYPVWLTFRGGRGLATACGGLFGITMSYTAVWCVVWLALKFSGLRMLPSNIAAIVATPALLWILPARWIEAVAVMPASSLEVKVFGTLLSLLLLLGHLNVFVGKGGPQDEPRGVRQ